MHARRPPDDLYRSLGATLHALGFVALGRKVSCAELPLAYVSSLIEYRERANDDPRRDHAYVAARAAVRHVARQIRSLGGEGGEG